jgi:alkyl sulfatase BDS1-like metallo-beta-lactamase superfamily hydrolase
LLTLEHSVLSHRLAVTDPKAATTLTLSRRTLNNIMLLKTSFADAQASGELKVEGDAAAFTRLLELLVGFERMFAIVGPRPTLAQRPAAG